MQHVGIDWWGNNVINEECERTLCRMLTLADGECCGPRMAEFH